MNRDKNFFWFCCCLSLLLHLQCAWADGEAGADKPVRLHRTVTRLTTFAYTETEIRRQLEKIFLQRPGRMVMVSRFAEIPPSMGLFATTEPSRQSLVLLWEAQITLSEPGDCEFGINRPDLPWAIFLNGEYLYGWQSSKLSGQNQLFTPARNLAAGRHTLQLVAVRKVSEELPTLRWRKNGLPAEGGELTGLLPLPAHGLAADAAQTAVWGKPRCFHFLDTDQYLHGYARTGTAEFLPATRTAGLQLTVNGQSQSIPLLPAWPLAEPLSWRSRLSSSETLLAARENLPLLHQMSWPASLPESWKENWLLRCLHYDRGGRLLSNKVIHRGFQETLPLSLPLVPESGRLTLQAFLFSVPVAKPVQVNIIRPGGFTPEISVRGESFWLQDDLAVLRCDPLPDLGQKPDRAKTALSGFKPARLYLFDEGNGDTHSSVDSPSFTQLLQQNSRINIGRLPVPVVAGRPDALRGLAVLGKLLPMRPDAALLNLGTLELQSGLSPERWCRTLLFMSQVCQAANITPVLLTWPPQPGISSSTARQSALLIKELGLALGIPVIDLYSAHIQEDAAVHNWFRNEFAEHLAPDATGQTWLAGKISTALQVP
ncbi:MAG: hypothetical protein GX564_00135 [Oligosphaeraceae bacterium]|nr:hypothetical protein [Oligosphaeraceae bacterium]